MAKSSKKRVDARQPDVTPGGGGTEATDDYLKAIFQLSGRPERQVQSKEIAERLEITGASVTNMLQKLATLMPPLVDYQKHHGVKLSKAGRRRALEIIRHHRLIETFLHRVLDYPWDEVHEEAERLEHFISERFEQRIAVKLGNPDFDPHGHAIPGLDGSLPSHESNALSQLKPGEKARVVSVSDSDPERLRYLGSLGVRPGVKIDLKEHLPFSGGYRLRVGKSADSVLLSESLAECVLVASR